MKTLPWKTIHYAGGLLAILGAGARFWSRMDGAALGTRRLGLGALFGRASFYQISCPWILFVPCCLRIAVSSTSGRIGWLAAKYQQNFSKKGANMKTGNLDMKTRTVAIVTLGVISAFVTADAQAQIGRFNSNRDYNSGALAQQQPYQQDRPLLRLLANAAEVASQNMQAQHQMNLQNAQLDAQMRLAQQQAQMQAQHQANYDRQMLELKRREQEFNQRLVQQNQQQQLDWQRQQQKMVQDQHNRIRAQQNRDRIYNERSRSGAAVGSAVGAAAGTYVGGPGGGQAGAQMGRDLGGALGNDVIREGINARKSINKVFGGRW